MLENYIFKGTNSILQKIEKILQNCVSFTSLLEPFFVCKFSFSKFNKEKQAKCKNFNGLQGTFTLEHAS